VSKLPVELSSGFAVPRLVFHNLISSLFIKPPVKITCIPRQLSFFNHIPALHPFTVGMAVAAHRRPDKMDAISD
jgi:hypothetical protein